MLEFRPTCENQAYHLLVALTMIRYHLSIKRIVQYILVGGWRDSRLGADA
jgi:hypothetical protein